MRAQSSNSGDVASAESSNSGDDATSIISMIDPSDVKDVVQFLKSSSPHPVSMNGCVKASNDTELASLISDAQGVGGDGQVSLCPGKVDFYNEIVLDKSITIICAGVGLDACILDGHGVTRHFRSSTGGLTLAFIGLVFFNGLTDDDTANFGGNGGSVFLRGSTNIIKGSLFYNNRATSSTGFVVSII